MIVVLAIQLLRAVLLLSVMDNTFIASWDIYGLEALITVDMKAYNLTESEKIVDILADNSPRLYYADQIRRQIQARVMRATMNSQRHYEIYVFDSEASIGERKIRELFADSPQMIVDLIREKGSKIYSNRLPANTTLIK